jgi:hypothetical protein
MLQPFLLKIINKYCQFINRNQIKSMKKNLVLNRVRGDLALGSRVFMVMR